MAVKLKKVLAELPRELASGRGASSLYYGAVAESLFSRLYQDFETRSQGLPASGITWKPLSPRTKGGPGYPALRKTGRLMESFRPGILTGTRYVPSSSDQYFFYRSNVLSIGSNVPYAHFHHFGTSRMPKRALWRANQGGLPKAVSYANSRLAAFLATKHRGRHRGAKKKP